MPKLIIDNMEVEVPAGTNVLEAAKKVGVVIPHFCYHPALGSVGACRLCAMKFVEGPVKGVQVSCMIEAKDGMVVSTTDGEAARLRRMVIEWLMLNHPHDCPVCDEGGMCLLQDYTVAGGHGIRRYKGKKRTYTDQYLGEFIRQEMNRCIQCYRCARFYKDYAGGTDFGPMQIANKVFFGRHKEGWLESEFSGNLADVCPTGVFTDRTARFRFRLWDLETAPSVCPHCSLGCSVTPGAKYRELMRVEARENLHVNGWFICDRGRFGYGFANHPDRPRISRVHGMETGYDGALKAAHTILHNLLSASGPESVAFLGSPRASLETNFAVRKLAHAIGSGNVSFSPDPVRDRKDRRAASMLKPGLARSLRKLESCDFIVCADVDPVNEAPMLALIMRQAVRKGARVTVIDPRPVKLPFAFTHIPARPESIEGMMTAMLASEAKDFRTPAIVVGTDIGGHALIDRASDAVESLKASGKDAGLFYVMDGPNSFGNALLAGDGPDFDDTLDGIIKGDIKALVVVESDPLGRYPDNEKVKDAFGRLDTLIVIDCLPTETAMKADVFMPSTAYAEEDGVYVNNEGRAQTYARAYISGIPINTMGPELHPPREFHQEVPGTARPAWQTLSELAGLFASSDAGEATASLLRQELAVEYPVFKPIAVLSPVSTGERLQPPAYAPPAITFNEATAVDGLTLISTELTFGTEELSTYSDKAMLKAPKPYVMINPGDASALGLEDECSVEVGHADKKFTCVLRVVDGCASGVAITPRLPGWSLKYIAGKRVTIKKPTR